MNWTTDMQSSNKEYERICTLWTRRESSLEAVGIME